MELIIKKQIGIRAYTFILKGESLFDVVNKANELSFPDLKKCGCCSSVNLELRTRKAKEKFEYTYVFCLACKASLNFGERKDKKGVYLRKNEAGEFDWKSATDKEKTGNTRQ